MSAPGAAREAVALFRLPERAVIEITGSDRVRWLNGMLTSDVQVMSQAGPGAGGRALVLTRQGRIVADLQLLIRPDHVLAETARMSVGPALAHLEKLLIADDVTLEDASARHARLALEGERAAALLEAAGVPTAELAPGAHAEGELAGTPVLAFAFGFSGPGGRQLILPAEAESAVTQVLRECGEPFGLVEGDAELFELLRVEAGTPLAGCELDESVLPDEAGLDDAVSTTKGCYTGQEVIARLRSRGRPSHLLVGLRFADAVPAAGSALQADGRRVGEVTSALVSPRFGPIGLGFVRHALAELGTQLESEAGPARVAPLPFAADPASG